MRFFAAKDLRHLSNEEIYEEIIHCKKMLPKRIVRQQPEMIRKFLASNFGPDEPDKKPGWDKLFPFESEFLFPSPPPKKWEKDHYKRKIRQLIAILTERDIGIDGPKSENSMWKDSETRKYYLLKGVHKKKRPLPQGARYVRGHGLVYAGQEVKPKMPKKTQEEEDDDDDDYEEDYGPVFDDD